MEDQGVWEVMEPPGGGIRVGTDGGYGGEDEGQEGVCAFASVPA